MMKSAKKKILEKKGWRFGSTAEFLELSEEEKALLELKMSLGKQLKVFRLRNNWTQVQFSKIVNSSQSRVAKMESGDPSVSLDLLVKSLLASGATRQDLALAITNDTVVKMS